MRIAFEIHSEHSEEAERDVIRLWDIQSLAEIKSPIPGEVCLIYSKGKLVLTEVTHGVDLKTAASILIRLQYSSEKLEKGMHGSSLFAFLSQLVTSFECQVAWDANLKKYRPVRTMKSNETIWNLLDVLDGKDAITIAANDEKTAVSRATKMIADMMQDHPEKATELCKWFSAGRKVEKALSGDAPAFVAIESLATHAEVAALAAAKEEKKEVKASTAPKAKPKVAK